MVNKKRLVAIMLAILMLVMECLSLFSCGKKVENFELSFNVDGENYATIITPGTETIQIPENPSKDGYTFDGWYWDKDVWSKPFTANSLLDAPISSDMSVYAKFTPIAYSISYEMDGGTHNNPATYTIESSFEFADAQKAGYTFLGWYTDAAYTTQIKSISAGTTGDMTLYAKFELATYSITYENTKDAENTNPTTYTINSETITFLPLSKDGYTFDGWYVGDTKVMEISKGSTGNLTLTAKWDTIGYSITYHNVDGATHTNPAFYDVEDQPLTLYAASKTGYRFVGWYTDESLTNKVTEIAVGTTGDLDLYAKWEIIEYTATFKDGDAVVGTVKFTVESDSITEPAVPEHTGYTGAWESYTLGAEDITVDAIYTLITYNIVYHNVDGANNTNPSNYDVEDQPLALLDASKDYYTFKGWYTDAEFNNKVTEIAVGTTGVVNLYAKWEAIEYTATFKDGNTSVGTVKFTVETDSITAPAVPEHTGYTGAWESYTLGHEDITINAVYTPITYTITYTETKGSANSNVGTYTIESETITLTDLSAVGYTFDGWYDGDTKVTQISAGSIGNLTLTAKWTAIKYSITYLYDHEIGDYADENKNPTTYTIEDEFVFIPLVNHTPGYTFDGWFTEKNNGTGDKVTGVALGTTGDITVYAQWGLENYTITYHNVNGATNTNAENYNVETETFNIEDISRTGYVFDGWYADAEFTTPASTTIVKGSTGNIDMYAKWTPIGYSITYILFGETVDDITNPDRYTIEDSFVLNNPTREGYVFVGWYTLNENGERVTEIKANTTGNQTLYARWIKFESNGGSAVSYTPVHSGNTISAPDAPTRAHYEFDGWYTNEELTQKYNFAPTQSITLYAKWIPVEYEIEYILNGGTNSKDNPDTYTVEDKFELCSPYKVGYTFVGWFTDLEFTSTVVTEIKAGTSGKITLYAHYLINQYTISFESNGGTTVSAITQNYATDVTAPEAPAKNGYEFAGWYSDAALKNAYTFTTMPAEDITLYAKWDIVTYDITYNLDGGTNHRNNPSTYKITSADIILGTPTKTGYTFDGWYTDSACTQSITKIANGSFGEIELFAKWTATVYTVTYNMPSGAIQSNATTYTIETNLITLTNATLKGHTFNGWYSDDSYTTPVTTIAGGAIGDVVLYAKFTANTYNVWLEGDEEAKHTVSFDLNGAEGTVASQTVTPTSTLKYPTAPTRDEYIFAGWYDNAACTGAPYDFTAVVTKDTTLYAKWVKIENASLITINGSANVTLNGKTEHMLVFVPLVSGNITITSSGEHDTFGTLYNSEMVAIAQNDDGAADGINFHIVYNVTAGETYYIGARAFSSTTTGTATVSISGNTAVLDGGYAITTSQTPITYGTSFTLTLPDARDGYKFLGYADANGVMYTDANGNSIKNWDKDEDTILYSVWERTVYTVTFVTSGGTPIDSIKLAYGDRFDISKYVTTRDGYTFNGWYLDGAEYNATTMPDHNITLTAYWKTFALGTIKYDTDKKAISVNDTITPELFDALCLDTNGNLATFTVSISGTQAAGETITVRLTATSGGKTKVVTITDIKVYGAPTLTFDDTVDYVNVNGGMTASHFGASGTDTFGAATQIKVYIDGEYEAGDLVTIVIESIDPAGNITYGYIENVKAYGLPEITYNENKTAIRVNDTLNAELFGATAKDSFGEELTVTVSRYSGTIAAGNSVIIRISATDSKGNVTNINVPCKVYGIPTISEATKTDVRADDIVTPELLGITGTDTYGEGLTVALTTKTGSQTAGTVWTVTATVTDAAGNLTAMNFELMVYGMPTIFYNRNAIKTGEDAIIDPTNILNVTAMDSFGYALPVTSSLTQGELISGTKVVYTLTATDHLGNTWSIDTAPIGVYDVNDINLTYSEGMSDLIKLTSRGEEFDAKATDSFGNACNITIEAAAGYTFAGGQEIILYIVATDEAGNRVLSEAIGTTDNLIKVYNTPIVTLNQDNRVVCESTDVGFLFTVHDSFGEELYANITVSGEQVVGNTIIVTVTATDDAQNTIARQYIFGVLPTAKPFVELYVNSVLWQTVFVNDRKNYSLPMPALKDGYEAFWVDSNGTIYTDTTGNAVLDLPNHIQLYCVIYKSGYIPIYTEELLKTISLDGKYYLTRDLKLDGSEWVPIGTSDSPFTGVFEGNGYSIFDFRITETETNAGLFGYNNGTIKNLGVQYFTIANSGYAGGLVAYNSGTIINCYATGTVTETSYAGGLVAYNSGTIINCYATGTVTGNHYAGGLVARNSGGTIMNCYATGDVCSNSSSLTSVAGGLIGEESYGTIVNCYAVGNVSSIINRDCSGYIPYLYAGGLIGDITLGLIGDGDRYSTIENCYCYNKQSFTVTRNTTTSYAPTNTYAIATTIENLQSKEWVENNLWTAEIKIWDFSVGYPTLDYYAIENSLVEITNTQQLLNLQGQALTMNYELVSDINLKGNKWKPIALFVGNFNGNGHTISNFEVTGITEYAGLFNNNLGVIKNLKIKNFIIEVSAPPYCSYSENYIYAGGVVGFNSGIISDCHANGSINCSSTSSNSTYRYSYSYAGGIVGYNVGNVETCSATVDIICHSNTTSGNSRSYSYAGGLIAYSSGNITDCYAVGDVLCVSDANTYESGGYSYAGGLVGYSSYGIITNCYATGDINANSNSTSTSNYAHNCGSRAGGLIGFSCYGSITNCYAIGNIMVSKFTSGISSSDAGGVIGDALGVHITNCYRYSNQTFTIKTNETTNHSATNSLGSATDMTDIRSIDFSTSTLGWASDIWNFVEGQHPTLKNVGASN